jgi:hypothetical protein
MPIASRRKRTKQAKKKTKPLTLPNQHSTASVQFQTKGDHHSLWHLPVSPSFFVVYVFCLLHPLLGILCFFETIITFPSYPHFLFSLCFFQ